MAAGASAEQVKALYKDVEFEELPLDGMRRTIATRLVEAKQTIPHFYLTADVTMDALLRLREDANAGAPKAGETAAYRLSVNDFVIKALALALQRIPAANAVWAGDRILRFKHSDVGVAVAIDGGLLTPVIRNAEAKSLSAISNEMRELAGRAKEKKLKPARIPGRRLGDLQSRHVRRPRVRGDHQPAAVDHPCGRRLAAPCRSRRKTAR